MARDDGRRDRAYPPQRTAALPEDFLRKVNRNKKAKAFLKPLSRANAYAIIFRLHNASGEKKRPKRSKDDKDARERRNIPLNRFDGLSGI